MKKLFCVLFVTLMLLSLCSCKDNNIRGSITPTPTDPQFSLGSSKNNTYKNDFLGLSCTLPSEWVFLTDEEILELNNLVGDMAGDQFKEALEKATVIYDMYATANGGLNSINVTMEKLNVVQSASYTPKSYMEAQFSALKTALENMGCSNVNIQYEKIMVDGKAFDGAKVTASISGVPFYETLFCFKKDRYMVNIAIGSAQTDQTAAILACFSVS